MARRMSSKKSAWKVKALVNGLACREVCSKATCQSVAGDESREKGGEREIESKGLRKWEKIQGIGNKKRQRSGPRLACLWRPAESECCLITIRVISFGLISPQHASTATLERTCENTLSKSDTCFAIKSWRARECEDNSSGTNGTLFSVLLTPPLVCLHNPFVHPLMTLAAVLPFWAQTHDPLVVFHGKQ